MKNIKNPTKKTWKQLRTVATMATVQKNEYSWCICTKGNLAYMKPNKYGNLRVSDHMSITIPLRVWLYVAKYGNVQFSEIKKHIGGLSLRVFNSLKNYGSLKAALKEETNMLTLKKLQDFKNFCTPAKV